VRLDSKVLSYPRRNCDLPFDGDFHGITFTCITCFAQP
jgi:hypothetical protein